MSIYVKVLIKISKSTKSTAYGIHRIKFKLKAIAIRNPCQVSITEIPKSKFRQNPFRH